MKLTPFMALAISMVYTVIVLIAMTVHIDLRFKNHVKEFHSASTNVVVEAKN